MPGQVNDLSKPAQTLQYLAKYRKSGKNGPKDVDTGIAEFYNLEKKRR
jgi:hypothetical protein